MSVEQDIEARNRIIGDNLRKYRALKGLTQDELAEGLCSVSQLSKVENGKTYIKRTLLKQMADRLGVTVERIEAADALLEDLTETLQLAVDALTVGRVETAWELARSVTEKSGEFDYLSLYVEGLLVECKILDQRQDYETIIQKINDVLAGQLYQDTTQKLLLLYELGHAYEQNGNMRVAYDCYIRADEEFDEGEASCEVRLQVLYNLLRCNIMMRNYRTALRYGEKAERLASDHANHLYRLRLSYTKAVALQQLGDYEKAEQIYNQGLREAQTNSYVADVGVLNNHLGRLYMERGELGLALAHLQRAQKVYGLLHDDDGLCETYLNLGEIFFREREDDKVDAYIQRVLDVVEQGGGRMFRLFGRAYRLRGQLRQAQGDLEAYSQALLEALRIYEQHQVVDEAYEVALELADAFYEAGDERALGMYRQVILYNERSLELGLRRA